MSKKRKYYTVWEGREPGVYDSWRECERQVKGFDGAKYKSFESLKEAEDAFLDSWKKFIKSKAETIHEKPNYLLLPKTEQPILDSIAVDAACSGNPGKMEYQGVDVRTGFQVFHFGPVEQGTNNIGEFLAIVHAVATFYKTNPNLPVYSDSKTAISWVKNKITRTRLEPTEKNLHIFNLIQRAEKWLQENTYSNPVLKWDTEKWGEIPADFGRK
ncbi:MAG: ribonuclease H [Bacteroidales bacterium]|nr:ribonuclease H [Bacteroidales bacterium]